MNNNEGFAKEQMSNLVEQWLDDWTIMFIDLFGESLFRLSFSPLHMEMLKIILDSTFKKRLILSPRGIGKTTLIKAYIICCILLRRKHFVVYISETVTQAELQTEHIKFELMNNPLIRKVFGDIRVIDDVYDQTKVSEGEEPFSKKSWVAFNNTFILPRGAGQQVRGLNWRGYRPDLLVLDDIEDQKTIDTDDVRDRLYNWFLGDLEPTVGLPGTNPDAEILGIDTLKHHDAYPIKIEKNHDDWFMKAFSICDDNLESFAPDFISTDMLKKKYETFMKAGKLDVFYREYRNISIPPELQTFRVEDFRFYTPKDIKNLNLMKIVIVDPAKTATPQADFSAIIGLGIDFENNRIYVLDLIRERLHLDDLYEKIALMCRKIRARVLAVEVTTLHMFISGPMKQILPKYGLHHVEFVELTANGKKEMRIAALAPFFRQHMIWFPEGECTCLMEELLTHGHAEHDDASDALAYIIKLLSVGGMFFREWELGFGLSDDDGNTLSEEEYYARLDAKESNLNLEMCI